MAFNSFDVTQVTFNFTATVSTPLELTLTGTDTHLTTITPVVSTVNVINNRQPITISGIGSSGSGGTTYNQSLNTTDNVSFNSLTVPEIYGFAGAPVNFPTGINAANVGTVFTGGLDLGSIFGTYTNILSLLFAALPIDMGTIVFQPQYNVDMGTI